MSEHIRNFGFHQRPGQLQQQQQHQNSRRNHHSTNDQPTSPTNEENSIRDIGLGSHPKRKSNAHLAAEIVQQERDAIRALKRLSMGGGAFNIDPDFQIAIESEYNTDVVNHTLEKKQRRKSSSSLSSENEDSERTLINDDETNIWPQQQQQQQQQPISSNDLPTITVSEPDSPSLKAIVNNQKIIKKLDTEKLLWVPAKSHPKIAPERFRRHVQNTLEDFKESNDSNSDEPDEIKRIRRIKKKSSIPSLKELTDELDRLSEMAGLAATDAVTLARSLSSASFNIQQQEQLGGTRETKSAPASPVDPFAAKDSSGNLIDEDAPILGYGNSLRRNQFSTYSRSTRVKRNNKNDAKTESTPNVTADSKPQSTQPLATEKLSPVDKENIEIEPTRSADEQVRPWFGKLELSDDSSDEQKDERDRPSSGSPRKKTNHSRRRHAGSVISLDNNQPANEQNETLKLFYEPSKDTTTTTSLQTHFVPSSLPTSQPSFKYSGDATVKKYEPLTPNLQENVFLDTESEVESEAEPSVAPITVKSKSKEFLSLFRKKRSVSSSTAPPQGAGASTGAGAVSLKEKLIPSRSISFDESSISSSSSNSLQEQASVKSSVRTSPKKSPQETPLTPSSSASTRTSPTKPKTSSFRFSKKKDLHASIPPAPLPSRSLSPTKNASESPPSSKPGSPQQTQFSGLATTQEQHRIQKESLQKKLLSLPGSSNKPNAPLQFQDSAFGFPLPPLSRSTIVMLDYRFPVHVERALYRLSHLKLANPKRELRQQVLLSNFMYAYLNLVNHTLYLQQLDEDGQQRGTSASDFLN